MSESEEENQSEDEDTNTQEKDDMQDNDGEFCQRLTGRTHIHEVMQMK